MQAKFASQVSRVVVLALALRNWNQSRKSTRVGHEHWNQKM